MSSEKPILAVGSIAIDTIETASGSRPEILGGSATYFAVAASIHAPVRLIGVVGDDFPKSAWDMMTERGIDMSCVQQREGETFKWGGRYPADFGTRETLFTRLGVFKDFQPIICSEFLKSPFVFLGNIQPELQLSVLDQVPDAKYTIADTMNLWISTTNQNLWEVIGKIRIFLLNDEEALQITEAASLSEAASKLRKAGPETVIIKMGAKGALIFGDGIEVEVPVFKLDQVVDPTGAGDCFAGGFISHLSKFGPHDLVEAVITGAATASFTVSGYGLEGLLKAAPETLEERRRVIKDQMKF